ncbi:MAG: CRISPR-associated helicase Cas3 [Bacillota bacterium]|nr:MAG: CRISPR-associated helicase Cas3 [Bacillota bacterium]
MSDSKLWSKTPPNPGEPGLSLCEHTRDVVKVMGELVDLYQKELSLIAPGIVPLLLQAALLHDLGKAHPQFQQYLRGGPPFKLRHEVLSLAMVSAELSVEEKILVAGAVVTHHRNWAYLMGEGSSTAYYADRKPASEIGPLVELCQGLDSDLFAEIKQMIMKIAEEQSLTQVGWRSAYTNMLDAVHLHLQEIRATEKRLKSDAYVMSADPFIKRAIIMRGFLMQSDYLASGGAKRVLRGVSSLPEMERLLFPKVNMWEHQHRVAALPANVILIAPTGAGKTESALLWSTVVKERLQLGGRTYFLLPYQASMNAMTSRLRRVFGEPCVSVIHGKSLIRTYQNPLDDGYDISQSRRMVREKEAIARLNVAPIRVSSPLQLIKAFFTSKGHEAIICGTLGAQIIFDEIHAYDLNITAMALACAKYLADHFLAKCLFMSATMPTHLRSILEEMFVIEHVIRPELRWLASIERHKLSILSEDYLEAAPRILHAAQSGLTVLVVLNQPMRAVRLWEFIRSQDYDDVLLFHSRFTAEDRVLKEQQVEPKPGRILIATQVVEVSLDIDYDTCFTELAPLESLLQRFGRVNRYSKRDPADVFLFAEFNGEQHKYAPYDKTHLQSVLAVLKDFRNSSADGLLREENLQELLDLTYSAEMKTALKKILAEKIALFERFVIREQLPLGMSPAADMEDLERQWEALFDGHEVIPACKEELALRCDTALDVVKYLVPLSSPIFFALNKAGHVRYSKILKSFIADMPYDQISGLKTSL